MRTNVRHVRRLIREVLSGFGNKEFGKDGVSGNLYPTGAATGDAGVRGSAHNINDDEADDEQRAKQADNACCLILSDDGRVLSVSRKTDPHMHGLPGGKVDPGEAPKDAAARELTEETGLYATKLSSVFSQRDESGYVTETFACEVDGQIDTDEAEVIRWVHPSVLVDPMTTPYVDYNTALFHKLGIDTQAV